MTKEKSTNINNTKRVWTGSTTPAGKISHLGDNEYVNLWEKHFLDFSGKILEIGAGNGFLAKNIMQRNKDVQYTILDIEAHFDGIRETLNDFSKVQYVKSSEYKKIFEQEYDLLVATHCLSETPRYYYTDILENLSVKNCFIIDYAGDPNDLSFQETLDTWFDETFTIYGRRFLNTDLIGGKRRPLPVYIGKST